MKTTVSSKGEIVLPAELRQQDRIMGLIAGFALVGGIVQIGGALKLRAIVHP